MRNNALTSLFTLSLIIPLAMGCARDADDTTPAAEGSEAQATAPQELEARSAQYIAAWNGNDQAAVAEFFMADATARLGDDSFNGRQEIQDGWLQMAVPNINDLEIHGTRTEQRGEDYFFEGTYTHTPFQIEAGRMSAGGGRTTSTWGQDADGQWRIRSVEVMPDEPPQP